MEKKRNDKDKVEWSLSRVHILQLVRVPIVETLAETSYETYYGFVFDQYDHDSRAPMKFQNASYNAYNIDVRVFYGKRSNTFANHCTLYMYEGIRTYLRIYVV